MRHWQLLLILPVLPLLLLLTGCSGSPALTKANTAFEQGQYRRAYEVAAPLAQRPGGKHRDVAAYLAGVSAQRLGDLNSAERFLRQATRSSDSRLAADAQASLGLIHHARGRFAEAARDLATAARNLEGDDRANAYFYAGVSHQKLNQWPQARTNLLLARSSTTNPTLLAQIDEQLSVTGYTVQLGAFGSEANARRLAERLGPEVARLKLGPPRLTPGKARDGSPLVLVQVGRFTSFDAAVAARNRLNQHNGIVVPLGR